MFSIRTITFVMAICVFGVAIVLSRVLYGEIRPSSIVIAFVSIGLAFLLLVFFFKKGIVDPIRKIQKLLSRVEGGDYSVRIEGRFPWEIDELAKSLNQAISQIRKDKGEVEEARTTLEIRVRARTRELRVLANSLEQKIQERTKELEEKVQELERFRRLAVGRELKMIELKEKIEQLQSVVDEEEKEEAKEKHKKNSK